MKKLTGIFLAIAIIITASSFTVNADTVSTKIQTAFKSNFAFASEVSWKKLNGLYCANFKVNTQNVSATYNESGELVAASRTLNLEQLPLAVIVALKSKLPNYTFDTVASEITSDGQNSYFVKAENDKNVTVLKVTGNTTINIESKTRKK